MLCWYLLTFTIYNDSQTWHLDRKCIDICRLFDILHINLVIRIIEVSTTKNYKQENVYSKFIQYYSSLTSISISLFSKHQIFVIVCYSKNIQILKGKSICRQIRNSWALLNVLRMKKSICIISSILIQGGSSRWNNAKAKMRLRFFFEREPLCTT